MRALAVVCFALAVALSRTTDAAGPVHTAAIRDLAVDRDGRHLVTGSDDGTVRIWDPATGRALGVIRPPARGGIHAVAISPDGTTIACGGDTGREAREDQGGKDYYAIYVHRRDGGRLLHTLAVPFAPEGLSYSPDGRFLVATSLGAFGSTSTDFGAERVFGTADYAWAKDALLPNTGAAATIAAFDGRGRLLVLQKFGTWTALLQGPDFHESRELPGIPVAASLSPDGARIAVAFADATVGVYSGDDLSLQYRPDAGGIGPAEVELTDEMDLADASLGTVAWSADGRALYYSGGRTCARGACLVRRWSDAGRGPSTDVTVAASRVTRLVALPNGGIAYAAVGPALGVLDAEDRRVSFFAAAEPPAASPEARVAEPAGPTLGHADAAALRELHATVTDLAERQRWREALPPARRAAEIVQRAGDPAAAPAAQALADLARVLHALGQYRRVAGESPLTMDELREALSLYGRAGPMVERGDPALVAALFADQGALLLAMGRYDQAADSFQQALARRTALLGADHLETARSASDLAAVRVMKLTAEKRLVDAFAAGQSALEAAERTLPSDDPALARALANLGEVHRLFRATSLDAAAAQHERALSIRRRALGPDHWDVVASLRALGEIALARDDPAAAELAYAEALATLQRALGDAHPALAGFMPAVARLQQSLGRSEDAERLYRRVLAIREQEGQPFRIARALEDLASLYRATGRHAEAEPLYTRSLAIREQHMGPSHFTVGQTARSLGTVLRVKGDLAGAAPLYGRAAAIHGDAGNLAGPWALRDLAALAVAQGDDRAALRFLTGSLAAQEPIFEALFRPDREETQLEAVRSRHVSGSYWFFLWLVAERLREDPQAVRDAAELVLRRKGLVFDALSHAIASRRNLSPEAERARDRLAAARTRLSALLLHRPRGMSEDEYRRELTLLFEQSSALERTLDRLAPAQYREPLGSAVSVESVRSHLPERGALVEFVTIPDIDYAREDFDFPGAPWDASWRYLAIVVPRSGPLRLVDLGAGREVDAAVDRVLRDMNEPDASAWAAHLMALHTRVWAPLGLSPGDVDQVVLAPDGALNRVPFTALMERDGTFLIERSTLGYVTTGRDLLPRSHPAPRAALLVAANPAFDSEPGDAGGGDVLRSRELVGGFDALPGTAREAEEIPSLVPGAGERRILTGPEATESAVKAATGPRVLHLATHGFFLADQRLGMPEAEYETPLVRSGLALAGANRAPQAADGNDGLLTALEVSGMDLSGTELVVLSACETGVGELRSGEGVFGLRRAFALAGAENLVMSLWRVSDAITAEEMRRFYANLRELPPAAALREAQLATIRELRDRRGEAPPRLWAPFVVQGGRALTRRTWSG